MTPSGLRNISGLRCVRCGATCALTECIYTCPDCGGNLQVEYDYDAIRSTWRKDALVKNPDRSIWRYAPLYPVSTRIESPPIGWTPLFRADRLAAPLGLRSLFIKDDGRNPSASFKDRASAVGVARAVGAGCGAIACASLSLARLGSMPRGRPP